MDQHIFRQQRWWLQRAIRTQVSWDRDRHRAVYRWEITFSNGAFVRYSMGKWFIVTWVRARYGLVRNYPWSNRTDNCVPPLPVGPGDKMEGEA
jgi:hypothetical protein